MTPLDEVLEKCPQPRKKLEDKIMVLAVALAASL